MTINTQEKRPYRATLAFRTVGDLAEAFDPGTLAAMQYDAEKLVGRADETAGAWQSLADALGAACAIAEHDERSRSLSTGVDQPRPVRKPDCIFCAIVAGEAPASVVRSWDDTIAIKPHGGVHPGHVLVIPRTHVADVGEVPAVSARTMACAAELAAELPAANVITSKGVDATQTVFHLHIHVVPRSAEDGLALPWTPQPSAAGVA